MNPADETHLKALKVLSWMIDLYPEGVSGQARIFNNDLVAHHLMSRGFIEVHTEGFQTLVMVSEKGKQSVSENQRRLGNA